MGADDTYRELASRRGLNASTSGSPGAVTPLLTKGGGFEHALEGRLTEALSGTIARYRYSRFTYNVVFARIPASQPFIPRLMCERRGRITDDTHYGFEVRNTRQWTESEVLNERFKVTTSPFQDPNWMRQLFSPTFIDWIGTETPGDFSFELAYGSLLCSVEENSPDLVGLEALWDASATVAKRIHEESHE